MSQNPELGMINDSQARIIGKKNWGDYFLLSLESPAIANQAHPGQFVMVRITSHPYPLLRRPLSIHSKEGQIIELFFQIKGLGTHLLSQKQQNESLDLLGPLGKGFHNGPHLKDKEVIVIGGGRGIAPLYFLAQELQTLGSLVKIFYGGKSLSDLPLREKFERKGFDLFCSTDDGSFGFQGVISDYFKSELDKFNPDSLSVCGPEPMMEKISQIAMENQIPAEFSLESVMGCGFGACWGCVKKIKKGDREEWTKICEEGPVFSGEEIIWGDGEK